MLVEFFLDKDSKDLNDFLLENGICWDVFPGLYCVEKSFDSLSELCAFFKECETVAGCPLQFSFQVTDKTTDSDEDMAIVKIEDSKIF